MSKLSTTALFDKYVNQQQIWTINCLLGFSTYTFSFSDTFTKWGFSGGSEVKATASNVGDPSSIPDSGRYTGEANGNPLQYSCLENPIDRRACRLQSSPVHFSSVQSLSPVRLFATPWIAARQASLSITSSRSSLRLMPIESVMPSSHLILCLPFFSCPQSLPASESFPMSQLFAGGGQSTGVSL